MNQGYNDHIKEVVTTRSSKVDGNVRSHLDNLVVTDEDQDEITFWKDNLIDIISTIQKVYNILLDAEMKAASSGKEYSFCVDKTCLRNPLKVPAFSRKGSILRKLFSLESPEILIGTIMRSGITPLEEIIFVLDKELLI